MVIFMLRKCIICGKEAEFYIPYARAGFCREHFISFYEKRIVKTLKKVKFKGGKVLVAISGGKDSVALLAALKRREDELNINVDGLYLNLGISIYSEMSEKIVREVSKILDVDTAIIHIKRKIGFTVPEAVRKIRRPACAICSIIKRWLINKYAYEKGYDYIATGHNMDDASTYYIKSLLTNSIEEFLRGADVITPGKKEHKLIARIRPQIFLREADNLYYVISLGLPFVDMQCPLAKGAVSLKYKRVWEEINKLNPIGQLNFLKASIKLKDMVHKEEVELKACKICGYPTTSPDGICSFCKIKIKVLGK